jgi:secreted trypsin-like serine protease
MPRLLAVVASLAAASVVIGPPAEARAGTLDMPIVGGTLAKPGDWPDVVAVFTEDGGLCSGTLLGADLVLTAGHCIGGKPIEVIIGSVDLARPDGERRAVKWARAYPSWESEYDVGIVMLENPVAAKQRAIAENCTSGKRNRLRAGTRLDVVGFGLTTKTATDNNTRLHAASIAVIDGLCEVDEACKEAVAPGGEFTAGGHGVDACFGDSGGPVYIGTSRGRALVGVVSRGLASWSEPCGEGGVFVRAENVIAWIESVSARKVDRVECDMPADDGSEAIGGETGDGGCHAAGGLIGNGFAIFYGALCVLGLRRARRARTTK